MTNLARLRHIASTLMLAVENDVVSEMEKVSIIELDKLVTEIEGIRKSRYGNRRAAT